MPSYMMGNLDAMGGISKRPKNIGDKCEVRRVIRDDDGVSSVIWVDGTIRNFDTNELGEITCIRCDIDGCAGYSAWYEPQSVRLK